MLSTTSTSRGAWKRSPCPNLVTMWPKTSVCRSCSNICQNLAPKPSSWPTRSGGIPTLSWPSSLTCRARSNLGNPTSTTSSSTRENLSGSEREPFWGKAFKTKGCLKSHERIHSNERPFECNECNRKFVRANELSAHKKIHLDHKPYDCNTCQKKFRTTSHLKSHMLTHQKKRLNC